MKYPKTSVQFFCVVAVAAVLMFSAGCKKQEGGASPVAGESKVAQGAQVEKTSFNEVTSQLDPGGNFYMYLSTEQWLDGVSGKVASWQQMFSSLPNMSAEDRANMGKGFGVLTKVIKDSGIEDVSGFGMSSIAIEPDLYRCKALLHHYPGRGTGFLWDVFGKKPHALAGLDMLPANTAMAVFSDADVKVVWSTVEKEIKDSGLPQARELLEQLPVNFEKATGMKWEELLASLGGEFGVVLTLDEARPVVLPIPGQTTFQVPEPGLMLFVKVNDETIFNRLDQELKQKGGQGVESADKDGAKLRTLPVPLPLPILLRPTLAAFNGYLIVASSDALVKEAMAVKGGKPGLKSSEEFQRLAKGIPTEGNQFCYMSKRFGKTLIDIQQRAMAMDKNTPPELAKLMRSFLNPENATYTYSVGVHGEAGWLTVGNGNRSAGQVLAASAIVAPVGLLAAIAIPNFVKARNTAQQNACINNLRQIDGAKQQWALENKKSDGDIPTEADLVVFLRGGKFPVCPAGGHYVINRIDTEPTCSVAKHELPK